MDWFERLTGFRETDYQETCGNLEVSGNQLRSHLNGHSYGIGALELVSLQSLRVRDRRRRGDDLPKLFRAGR